MQDQLDDGDQNHLKQQEICTKIKQIENNLNKIDKFGNMSLNSITYIDFVKQLIILNQALKDIEAIEDLYYDNQISTYIKKINEIYEVLKECSQKDSPDLSSFVKENIMKSCFDTKNNIQNICKELYSTFQEYSVSVDPIFNNGQNYTQKLQKEGIMIGNEYSNECILNIEQKQKIQSFCEQKNINQNKLTQEICFLMRNGYSFINILGNGGFSTVIKSISQQFGEVAIKIIDKADTFSNEFNKEVDIISLFQESKYLIKFYEKLESESSFFLVIELCECSLSSILKENKLTMSQIYILTRQLLLGICEMKKYGIAHCDIKPENILYNSKKNCFVYCDFGISKTLLNQFYMKQSTVDVYSLGVVLAEIIEGRTFSYSTLIAPRIRNEELLQVIKVNQENEEFCNTILINMVRKDQLQRLEPDILLYILDTKFQFQENALETILKKYKRY